jgi:Na+-translocating ferredoxin:NAD+ oxidoreductase subunit C
VLKTFTKGGIHPPEHKFSAGNKIKILPPPDIATIPIAQHIGVPATPLVKKGDDVKAGQVIAKAEGFVSAFIHSSVSGKVLKIDPVMDVSGYKKMSVIIQVDGDEWMDEIIRDDNIKKDIDLTGEEIVKKVQEAGIVGLGGATFPSHVKLSVPKGKKADHLILNGVECEPYLTADHMLMLEKGEEILVGARLLMKALGVNKTIIGIENNKPDAIAYLQKLASSYDGISVQPLKVKYPQGGEKQLIKAVLNREVPPGGLPIDVGTVVFNVGSAFAVYEAVQKNKPLMERVLTVTGKSMTSKQNYRVRIGTPVKNVIEAAGGLPEDTGKVISGGPMMGKALNSLDIPVIKGSSGILVIPEPESVRKSMKACIRCTKCVSVCPMALEPYLLMTLSEKAMYDRAESNRITDCIECGSCSYICPADRPLLDYVRLGKSNVIKIIRSRKS